MQDDNSTITMARTEPAAYAPQTAAPVVRRKSTIGALFFALIMFLLGAGLVGYLAWQGELDRYLPAKPRASQSLATDNGSSATAVVARQAATLTTQRLEAAVPLEARLAMLEDRFSRLDFKADAASGNAARAEGLLIAMAARRQIERGEPLGYVTDQLQLRFADAQPQAVGTIIAFSRSPVTLDQLAARLDALAPNLTDRSQQTSFVERTRRAIAGLFVVHTDSPTLLAPSARIDRARLMLTARRIVSAIDEVERLPGADAANKWIADARRFDATQRALDLIETTAMMEPRRLKDGSGQNVNQPSPLTSNQPTPQPQFTPKTQPEAAPSVAPERGPERGQSAAPTSPPSPVPTATPSTPPIAMPQP